MEEGYRGGGNTFNKGGTQIGPRKDPNAMDIDRRKGGNRTCYVCVGNEVIWPKIVGKGIKKG